MTDDNEYEKALDRMAEGRTFKVQVEHLTEPGQMVTIPVRNVFDAPTYVPDEREVAWDCIGHALAWVPDMASELRVRAEAGGDEYRAVLQLAAALAQESAEILKYATEYARLMGEDPDAIIAPTVAPNSRYKILAELIHGIDE